MNVLQHTRNERNPCLKQNRPDRSYRDTLSLYMTEVLHLVMMKTHRNFGCLPLDGFKGITPVKTKLQNFNTIFALFWMVKCILTRNGTSTKKNWT